MADETDSEDHEVKGASSASLQRGAAQAEAGDTRPLPYPLAELLAGRDDDDPSAFLYDENSLPT